MKGHIREGKFQSYQYDNLQFSDFKVSDRFNFSMHFEE